MYTNIRLAPGFPLVLVGVLAMLPGCRASSTNFNNVRTLHVANLDDCDQVRLLHCRTMSRKGLQPWERSEKMMVMVEPRRTAGAEYVLKHVDGDARPSWSRIERGHIEARSDAARQRIWFVDTQTGRIAGSIDRASGQTTGPDDNPPAWATPTAGEPLELVAR